MVSLAARCEELKARMAIGRGKRGDFDLSLPAPAPDVLGRFRKALAVQCAAVRHVPVRESPLRARGGTRYGRKVVSLTLFRPRSPRERNGKERPV